MARKSLKNTMKREGFRIIRDGTWIKFIGWNGKVAFQVSRDNLFDADGNYFMESFND